MENSNNITTPTSVLITINGSTLEITSLDTAIDGSMTKAGVWGFYDENGNLLDVHQTNNIAVEWKGLSEFTGRTSFTRMRKDGIDLSKTTCKVITFEDDLERRLLIEQAFAIKYRAKYWHPQPYTFQGGNNNTINYTKANKETKTKITEALAPTTSLITPSHDTVSINVDGSTREITSLDIVIDDSTAAAKPGVIGLYNENGVLLSVSQTNNIAAKWSKRLKSNFIHSHDGIDKATYRVIAFEDSQRIRNKIKCAFETKHNINLNLLSIDDLIGNTKPWVISKTASKTPKFVTTKARGYKETVDITILPGYDESKRIANNKYGYGTIKYCKRHQTYYVTYGGKYCPLCMDDIRTRTCTVCNKEFKTHGEIYDILEKIACHTDFICDDCKLVIIKNDKSVHIDTNSQIVTWPNGKTRHIDHTIIKRCQFCNNWSVAYSAFGKCSSCGSSSMHGFNCTCILCGETFPGHTNTENTCSKCKEAEFFKIRPAVKKYQELSTYPGVKIYKSGDDEILTIPITNKKGNGTKQNPNFDRCRNCQRCHRRFKVHGSANRSYCGSCSLVYTCANCGFRFVLAYKPFYPKDAITCSLRCAREYDRKKAPENYFTPHFDTCCLTDVDIDYTPLMIPINETNINQYSNVSGVWCRMSSTGEILQVSQTTNIEKEYRHVQITIDGVINGINSTCFPKYNHMNNDGVDLSNTKCYVVVIENDITKAKSIEMNFALKHNVKYWDPDPCQASYPIK